VNMINRFYEWFLHRTASPDDRGGISTGFWQGKVREAILSYSRMEKGIILDNGCGEGLLLRKLLKTSPSVSVVGVDLLFKQLAAARANIAQETGRAAGLIQADATRLPFKDGTFDIVVAINLTLNMPTQDMLNALFMETARVCKDGGRIMFDIRNSLSPLIYVKYKLAPLYDASAGARTLPLTVCHPDQIEKRLDMLGFHVINKTTIGFPKGRFAPVMIFEARKVRA
jgi:ubiquinone/menaquinone biosynthesis C-methylase UbiE